MNTKLNPYQKAIADAKAKGFTVVTRKSNGNQVHAFTRCLCNQNSWNNQKAYWFSSKSSWALWCPRCGSRFASEADYAFVDGRPKVSPVNGGRTLRQYLNTLKGKKSVVVE